MAAITEDSYLGNGTSKTFGINFEYLEETDVKVSIDGVDTTEYIFANATQITFNTAPATGTAIRIYRVTNNDSSKSTFFAGSAIRAQDLNRNFTQNLFSVQEISQRSVDATQASFTNDVNLNDNKIINLANGTAAGDAVNKAQLDASQTYNNSQLTAAVNNAAASATTASEQADAAADSATAAAAAVTDAEEAATNAADSATAANTAATNAASSASAAASFAGSTVFFGFRRTANSNLVLDYSSTAETDTYATRDYEVKGGSQWYIGSNDVLHQSGPLLGQPRFAFNADGHLILSDT